jgi:hypothetical protein
MLPPREFESERQLAARTGLSVAVLRKWRTGGIGPPYYRLGPMRLLYRIAEVDSWINSNERAPDTRRR